MNKAKRLEIFELNYFIFYFVRTEETAAIDSASGNHIKRSNFTKTTIDQKSLIKQQNPHNEMLMVEENKR